jgi:hypothetical protein
MLRHILAFAAASMLAAGPVLAAPEQDMERQASMALRFEPFDKGGGSDWSPAFPAPFFRTVAAGKPEPVPLQLKPGAYMIVVLCNCKAMEVTLVTADGSTITPLRSNEQGAMYSLDVKDAGGYLAGIDMDACDEASCDFAIKVYRKKA